MAINDGIWNLAELLDGKPADRATNVTARVTRVDSDGTIWAALPGADTETPVNASGANVSAGDYVAVEIGGNGANIVGNNSAPAVGQRDIDNAVEPIATAVGVAAQTASDAQTIAEQANAVATATNQYFWHDTNGAHVSIDANDPTGASNSVWNSLGLLIRRAANYLVSITSSAIAFYDGNGNNASNIVASFGANGAQIGKTSSANVEITANSVDISGASGTGVLSMSTDGINSKIESDGYQLSLNATHGTDLAFTKLEADTGYSLIGVDAGSLAYVEVRDDNGTTIIDHECDRFRIGGNKLLIMETHEVSVPSTSAGSNYSSSAIDISSSGYTALGVLQTYWSTGTSQNKFNDYGTHTEGNSLYVRLWNAGTSAASGKYQVVILYAIDELTTGA